MAARVQTSTNTKLKTDARPRDLEQTVAGKLALGQKIVRALSKAAMQTSSRRVHAVAKLVARCVEAENVRIVRGMTNERGEQFDGYTNLFHCRQRVCPLCVGAIRRRSRRRATRALLTTMPAASDRVHHRFVTLTFPRVAGMPTDEAIKLANAMFRRLTLDPYFVARVHGYIKSVEAEPKNDGTHAHLHLILFSEFIERDAGWQKRMSRYAERHNLAPGNLAAVWTECVKAEWQRRGITQEIKSDSGLCSVDVQDVRAKGHDSGPYNSIPVEQALNEVAKYVTKSTSFLKLESQRLAEIVEVRRWPRMFELGGCYRSLGDEDEEIAADPGADEFEAFDEETGEVITLQDSQGATSKLDTRRISVGDDEEGRKPPLLKQAEVMEWEEWLKELDRRVLRAQEFRLKQLAERYPTAQVEEVKGDGSAKANAPPGHGERNPCQSPRARFRRTEG